MFYVVKANGEKEAYDQDKLRNSIERAGISRVLETEALKYVENKLRPNITTHEIYKNVLDFLGKSKEPYSSSKYQLKEAIMRLGPTGYPFEDFVAKLLEEKGYKTTLRQVVLGKCISHEIDIIARKNEKKIMIEAKYHNLAGTKTDVHVALYTKARFDDVKERNSFGQAWLITNTKCTIDAISYCHCMDIKVISWNYPQGESLRDLVEQTGKIPITALTTLSDAQKQKLLQNHIILSTEIKENPTILDRYNINGASKRVMDEINFLSQSSRTISG